MCGRFRRFKLLLPLHCPCHCTQLNQFPASIPVHRPVQSFQSSPRVGFHSISSAGRSPSVAAGRNQSAAAVAAAAPTTTDDDGSKSIRILIVFVRYFSYCFRSKTNCTHTHPHCTALHSTLALQIRLVCPLPVRLGATEAKHLHQSNQRKTRIAVWLRLLFFSLLLLLCR